MTLGATCPNCGETANADARYCPSCGSAMRSRDPGPSLQVGRERLASTQEERRVVSVLFADLTGSTPLAERLDPEDMRGVLERFFAVLAREILKLDGTVDKFVGDEIMAVFGAPVAHEDDAARAVTAALEMRRSMTVLNDSLDPRHEARLELRIGINTGEVVSGLLAGQLQAAYTVVGDTVNTAKRIQGAARPGEILVGERTRQATSPLFTYEDAGAVTAKGKAAPVQAYRVMRESDALTRATTGSRLLVGRERERDALLGAIRRLSDGAGGVVAITGDPGIGKTRLLAEAREAAGAAGIPWLQGQASSNGQSLSYLPFRDMLRGFASIDAADRDDVKWTKLERAVNDVLPVEATDILPFLGAALAVPLPADAAERVAALDGDGMRRQVLRSVFLLFDGIARRAPTVVAFEDLHWFDRSSEQLLAHVLPLAHRLLFIWTGRRESGSAVDRALRASRDGGGDQLTEIALAPLSADESEILCCDLLGLTVLPAGLRDAVVRRAEGNPFFCQEILRTFRDIGALKRGEDDGQWSLVGGDDPATIPTTIQGLIAARVDRLSEDAREVARVASVIGRTFSYRLLVTVSGAADVTAGLEELERQAVVRPRPGGERAYGFAHALVQETVYGGILVRRRREVHARIAAAMELLYEGRIEEHYGVLAYHYAQAENWSKAQEYLFRVGDQALRIAADAEAVEHYERALDAYARAFGERWDPFERAAVERKIGEARYRLGEFERATRHLDRALELLRFRRPRTRTAVRISIATEVLRQAVHRLVPAISWSARRPPEIKAAALQTLWFLQFIDYAKDLERLLYDILRSLNIAESTTPSHGTLRAYFGMTFMCHNIGLHGMGTRYARMADRMAAQVGGTLAGAIAKASTGMDHLARGDWDAALADLHESVNGYYAAGDLEPWSGTITYEHMILVARGRLAESLAIADEVERTGKTTRDRRIESVGPSLRGHSLSWAGRHAESVADYRRALAGYREIGDPHFYLPAAAALAQAHLRVNEVAEARALVDECLALVREHRIAGWWLTWVLDPQASILFRDAAAASDEARRRRLLDQAERVCKQLRKQGRLSKDSLVAAFRHQGTLEWLRGRPDRARAAWDHSIAIAKRLGAVTLEFETREAAARFGGSAADREAAEAITRRLTTAKATPAIASAS